MVDQSHARRALDTLIDKYMAMTDIDRTEMSAEGVVHELIEDLLRNVLGYPISDPKRYRYELEGEVGQPNITFIMPNQETLYIQAQRLGAIESLYIDGNPVKGVYKPDNGALTSVGRSDRTPEEQRVINDAFSKGATWLIFTNFEKWRLFNVRHDVVVLSFETTQSYRDEFQQLWQFSFDSVKQGSLVSFTHQRQTMRIDNPYLAFINDMREKLMLDLWRNRAQNTWLMDANDTLSLPLLRNVVQRFLDRIVMIRFAEDYLVLPAGELPYFYETAPDSHNTFVLNDLINQIFQRFHAQHYSNFFTAHPADKAQFSDDVLANLVNQLYEVRYRSMNADVMGSTYEEYLGKTIQFDGNAPIVSTHWETRKQQISYYTPPSLVQHLVDTTLGRYLYATHDGTANGDLVSGETPQTLHTIGNLRVLDATCGGGSFLIYAYQVLAGFYLREIKRIEDNISATTQRMTQEGAQSKEIQAAVAPLRANLEKVQDFPYSILEQHLYGVDIDPQASELTAFNLILRSLERHSTPQRLPMVLNHTIKTANSLVGMRPDNARLQEHSASLARLVTLRRNLRETDPHTPRYETILHELENVRQSLLDVVSYESYFSDIQQVNPFHWGIEFPEVFYDERGVLKADGGFTIVIGNPLWDVIRPNLDKILPENTLLWRDTPRLIEECDRYYRESQDYVQQGKGDTVIHQLFTERGYSLLAVGGRLGYVIPDGIYTNATAKPLRQMLLNQGRIDYIYSFSNEGSFFADMPPTFKFTLLSVQKGVIGDRFTVAFRFNQRVAIYPNTLQTFLADRLNLIEMRYDSQAWSSSDNYLLAESQSEWDYRIAEALYADYPVLGEVRDDTWNVKFSAELHMTSNRDLFHKQSARERVPLYEGKMIQQFNAYFSSPQYWVNEIRASQTVKNKTGDDYKRYRLAFREITHPANERTWIACMLPPSVFLGHTGTVTQISSSDMPSQIALYLQAVLNSFCADYIIRYKVNAHVTIASAYQTPAPRLTADDPRFAPIVLRSAYLSCHDEAGNVYPAFVALWNEVKTSYPEAMNSIREGFGTRHETSIVMGKRASDEGNKRQQMRDELDALIAHLYGINVDDYTTILKTFSLVFPATDEGEYRLNDMLQAYKMMS